MTNKQLYNLVFENFVQAKRELIKEGYTKKHLEEVDFNEIFDQTKRKMLEEKVKSLKRENEMLKSKLAKKELRKEGLMGSMGSTSKYETGGAGSETVGNWMTKAAAPFSKTAKADVITDRMIDNGVLSDNQDISKFRIKVTGYLKSGLSASEATRKALGEIKAQTSLNENKRKRRRY
jgi:hypothetical protein